MVSCLFFLNYLHGSEHYNQNGSFNQSFLNYLHGSEQDGSPMHTFAVFLNYLHGSEPHAQIKKRVAGISKLPTR